MIQLKMPTNVAILSGASEKFIMPSSEYLNNDQKFQVVSPAERSLFS